jgi:uncharacterized membrane protein YdjX (TVP38/TMEM64 family)
VVSGALFGVPRGFCLVILCATIGPTISFGLSHLVGEVGCAMDISSSNGVVFSAGGKEEAKLVLISCFFYGSLRFFPIFSLISRRLCLTFPLTYFVVATFFGIMPATFMHVSAGQQLAEMTDLGGQFSFTRLLLLSLLGGIVLLPTWPPVQRRLDAMLNRGQELDLDGLTKKE